MVGGLAAVGGAAVAVGAGVAGVNAGAGSVGAPSQARALVPAQAPAMKRARRVMAEPKAMVVVLMLVAEMVMARVVVEVVIAENLMGWRGGQ